MQSQKQAFNFILGSKIQNVMAFNFKELEEVLCSLFGKKRFKAVSTILNVKFNRVSPKSIRFINRLCQYLDDKQLQLADLLQDHIQKTNLQGNYVDGIERDIFYLKMHEFGLRSRKEPIHDIKDFFCLGYKTPMINVTRF